MLQPTVVHCAAEEFYADVQFLEERWRRVSVADFALPVIDLGTGDPLIFVPILEHLEFVYVRQLQALSSSRRVILYRRRESRRRFVRMSERVEELRALLDALDIPAADLAAHGDAAMVLFEFALRYPERCRSLTIVAQGADYRIAPHPFIWLLHELFLRLPIERLVPAAMIRRTVVRYITYNNTALNPPDSALTELSALSGDLIEQQFCKIDAWPAVYRYSVLPVIHSFDIRARLVPLIMPVLLINRWDDALSPEAKTAWLAQQLPNSVYHVVAGHERFFIYSQAEHVTPLIEHFLATR